VTTGELDRRAADVLLAYGARSGPVMTYAYPGSICVSVDEEVVHGIPGGRTLKEGEVVS
jgi:methionyl aminopeptidase